MEEKFNIQIFCNAPSGKEKCNTPIMLLKEVPAKLVLKKINSIDQGIIVTITKCPKHPDTSLFGFVIKDNNNRVYPIDYFMKPTVGNKNTSTETM